MVGLYGQHNYPCPNSGEGLVNNIWLKRCFEYLQSVITRSKSPLAPSLPPNSGEGQGVLALACDEEQETHYSKSSKYGNS